MTALRRASALALVLWAAAAPLAAAAAPAARPAIDPRAAAGFESIRESDLRGDLTFLAAPALAGRMSLQPGSEVAIEWIAAEFEKAGLRPAGDSFFQAVPLVEYRPEPAAMGLSLTRDGKVQAFTYLKDFYGGFPRELTLSAPVVFAGYGISAPEFGYDDYAGLDARGAVVLVFDHEPQESDPRSVFNGIGNTRHANGRLKALVAQGHGAVAMLVAPEPNRKHPSNIERLTRIAGFAERIRRFPSQAIADDEVRIPALSLDDATAAAILAAQPKKPAELQSAIDEPLRPASAPLPGATVEVRIANAETRRGVSRNVVGVLEGRDSALKQDTVVFSGHFDHDGVFDGKMFPGADDNGSGTVGVVDLARAFAKNRERPRRTLVFAVFAAEERGLLGSYYYALHPLRPLDATRAVINFDMIGRNEAKSAQTEGLIDIAADTSNELNLIGTINSPEYRAAAERANREVGLALSYKWDADAALNIFQRSDQFPFARRDIPAVWWFTGFHPDYHQPTDTVEKINFAKMAKILRLAYLTGWTFAEDEGRPRFIANPRTQK
jgi:Peptidase family M28/PA domain